MVGIGESFFDGCNTCFCGPGGVLGCTARACLDVTEPPPPMCVAPDGSSVPLGANWSSPDGCTQCFCDMSGSLSCATRSDCPMPPPPACLAPDGTPVPVGASVLTANFCLRCSCSMPGQPATCVASRDPRCGDGGSPTVCRAPDGSSIAVGAVWVSPDSCTRCLCQPTGRTACSTDPSCMPDAGVCVDPSGSPIPVGACFADTCRQCCCTASGLSCREIGGPGCADSGVPTACNNVAPSTLNVTPRAAMGLPPPASGGVIPDGEYQLRDLIFYRLAPTMGSVRYAVRVTRGTMQFNVMAPGSPTTVRANFAYTTGGTLIRLTPTCSDGGMAGPGSGQFSVRRGGFDLFIDSSGSGQVQHMVFDAR